MDEKKIEEVKKPVYKYDRDVVEKFCQESADIVTKANKRAEQAYRQLRQLLGEQHG